MDAPAGLEPTQAESKSAVLPLDEGAMVGADGFEPTHSCEIRFTV